MLRSLNQFSFCNATCCRLTIKPSKKLQRELRETFENREIFCETCPEPVKGFAQFAPFALEKRLDQDCLINLERYKMSLLRKNS